MYTYIKTCSCYTFHYLPKNPISPDRTHPTSSTSDGLALCATGLIVGCGMPQNHGFQY